MSTGTEAHAPTAGEYIVHHLTHLNSTGHAQTAIIDWSVWNLDTLFFSIGLGVVTLLLLMKAASKATSGVPGRFQAAVEILVEMVADQAKGIVHSEDGKWLHFDYVPEEHEVRFGTADYTGRLCVIGSNLKEDGLKQLFGL